MEVEKWTPERRMARTRQALLDSARQVFAQRGFEGASLDGIAEAAGYTRGAIAKHFANKEDLFFAVVDDFNERVLQDFDEQVGHDASSAFDGDAIASIWMHALSGGDEMWALGLEFGLYEYRNPAARQRAAAHRRRTRDTVANYMERTAPASGIRLKLPAVDIAAMLLVASDGFIQSARVDPDAEHHFARFLELFLPTVIEAVNES